MTCGTLLSIYLCASWNPWWTPQKSDLGMSHREGGKNDLLLHAPTWQNPTTVTITSKTSLHCIAQLKKKNHTLHGWRDVPKGEHKEEPRTAPLDRIVAFVLQHLAFSLLLKAPSKKSTFLGKTHWPMPWITIFSLPLEPNFWTSVCLPHLRLSPVPLLDPVVSLPHYLWNQTPGFWGVGRWASGQSLALPLLTSCRTLFTLFKPLLGHGGQM